MGRLIIIFALCVIGLGLIIQYNVSFAWFGQLPGDTLMHYGDMAIQLPFTTAIIFSLALSVFLFIFSKN